MISNWISSQNVLKNDYKDHLKIKIYWDVIKLYTKVRNAINLLGLDRKIKWKQAWIAQYQEKICFQCFEANKNMFHEWMLRIVNDYSTTAMPSCRSF
jgi:hypothetical protein